MQIRDVAPAFAGAGTTGVRRRERDIPRGERCHQATRMIIASGSDSGIAGRRTARCAAPLEELDDDHATAAAGTWRATLGCGAVCLSGVVRCRRLCRRLRCGDQLAGSCDIGFAAGAGEQPIMADAVKSLGQEVKQETPDELVGSKGHCSIPRLPVAAIVLVAEGETALIEGKQAAV